MIAIALQILPDRTARIEREIRADEAQIQRDKAVKENRRADRAAVEKNNKEDLTVLIRDKLAKKNAEALLHYID